MATKSTTPTIKAVIKTPTLRVELSGHFPGARSELLMFCGDQANREAVIAAMQATHIQMCENEGAQA